jgi:hypothetical protein
MQYKTPTDAALRLLASDGPYDTVEILRYHDDPVIATQDTVDAMRKLVQQSVFDVNIQKIASALVAYSPSRDREAWTQALHAFMADTIFFKPDSLGTETLRSASQVAHEIKTNGRTACDCDDATIFASSVVAAMGLRPYFVLCRHPATQRFVHVHAAAELVHRDPATIVPIDPQQDIKPGKWTCKSSLRYVVLGI